MGWCSSVSPFPSQEILRTGDLEKLTPKSVRNQLESEFDCSLRSKRKWLKEQTQLIVQELEGRDGLQSRHPPLMIHPSVHGSSVRGSICSR